MGEANPEVEADLPDENPFADPAELEVAEEVEEATDDDGEESEEEEGEEQDAKGARAKAFSARLKKSVSKFVLQRDQARDEAGRYKKQFDEAKAQASALSEILGGVKKRYAGNVKQLDWDHDFLTAAEEAAKTDPEIGRAMKKVIALMGKGESMSEAITTVSVASAEAKGASPTKGSDAALTKLARNEVRDVLTKARVDPDFIGAMAQGIVSSLTVEQMDKLDEDAVLEHGRAWLKANGIPSKKILLPSGNGSGTSEAARGIPRGGQAKAATQTAAPAKKAAEARAKKPRTFEEQRDHRADLMRGLADELSAG